MNKTQLTKGLNKLGKIVKNNERDLRNILDDEIYAIFPQAEDVEIDKDEIKFYLGEYTGRVTKKDLVDVLNYSNSKYELNSTIMMPYISANATNQDREAFNNIVKGNIINYGGAYVGTIPV